MLHELLAVLLRLLLGGVVVVVLRTRCECACAANEGGGQHPWHDFSHNACKLIKLIIEFIDTKYNNDASHCGKHEKPYIDAGGPRVK
jgi:hypothetical protein